MVTYYAARFYRPMGAGNLFIPMAYVGVTTPAPQPAEEVGVGTGRSRLRTVFDSHSHTYGPEGFLEAYENVRGRLRKRKRKEYVDPLEVLRDKAKTEERVKKHELRVLRKEVAKLSREKEALRAERSLALDDALRRIYRIEAEVARLGKMVAALSGVHVRDPRFSLRPPSLGRQAKGLAVFPRLSERPSATALAAPAAPTVLGQAPPDLADRVLAGLPFWLGATLAALGTYWLIPPKERTFKFAGYAVAAGAAAAGFYAACRPSPGGS